MNGIDWVKIINKTLEVFTPFLVIALISLISAFTKFLWSKAAYWVEIQKATKPKLAVFLETAASFGATAAEQIKLAIAKNPELLGLYLEAAQTQEQALKNYAISAATRWLEAQGIKGVDIALVADAVERAVFQQFNAQIEKTSTP